MWGKRAPGTNPFFYWLRVIVRETLFAVVLGTAGVSLAVFCMYRYGTPPADDMLTRPLHQTSIIYDRSGEYVLYALHGEENRKILAHKEIPDVVRRAAIAIEDANFYQHQGVDFSAIIRAFKVNFSEGGVRQGGSTITQQLARNMFYDRRRTLQRKMLEAVMALKIERHFSKDEILDLYLNQVPYGSNAYGIEAAARTFFGQSAHDLTLDQAVMLAALPKAPTYYSPYGNHRMELITRKDRSLGRMLKLGLANQDEVSQALGMKTLDQVKPLTRPIQSPHFVFYVLEELEREYGRDVLEVGGWKIYTTLDMEVQGWGEEAVRVGVARNLNWGAENAALTAVDPKTGEVLAMAGSKNFFDRNIDGEVNVALRPRQPGSAFKPFAYAKAFEKGFQPETLLYDVSTNFGPDGSGRDYKPHNYDGRSHGLMSMRQALSRSLNIPAVQTLYLAGVQETIDLAHRLGITTLNEKNRYGLALVLGGGEVKLLDMVAGFSVFATEGIRHEAHGVLRITDAEGQVINERKVLPQIVLDAEIARKINTTLSDNEARSMIFGLRSPLYIPGRTVAAKTGTTQSFRDAWTVGYTRSIAAGVWVGNNDNRPMRGGADGVFVAAPIWNAFMQKTFARFPDAPFIPYTVVATDKPMLGGSQSGKIRYIKKNSGKKLSKREFERANPEDVMIEVQGGGPARNASRSDVGGHSILYYVNKDDPLGPSQPNFTDPMLARFEAAIGREGVVLGASDEKPDKSKKKKKK